MGDIYFQEAGYAVTRRDVSRQGMGLQNIYKRAGIIGGEATFNSDPGRGTRIMVSVPYP